MMSHLTQLSKSFKFLNKPTS